MASCISSCGKFSITTNLCHVTRYFPPCSLSACEPCGWTCLIDMLRLIASEQVDDKVTWQPGCWQKRSSCCFLRSEAMKTKCTVLGRVTVNAAFIRLLIRNWSSCLSRFLLREKKWNKITSQCVCAAFLVDKFMVPVWGGAPAARRLKLAFLRERTRLASRPNPCPPRVRSGHCAPCSLFLACFLVLEFPPFFPSCGSLRTNAPHMKSSDKFTALKARHVDVYSGKVPRVQDGLAHKLTLRSTCGCFKPATSSSHSRASGATETGLFFSDVISDS